MKVLMLSTDYQVFEPASEVRARMRDYAGLVNELWVVVLGRFFKPQIIGNLRLLGFTRRRALFWRPREKLEVVSSQDPFETGFIAWRLARRLGARFQLQIHTDFLSPYFWRESLKNKVRVLLAGFLLPKADGIRVCSQSIVDSLKNYKLKTTPVVLPVFVDIEKWRQAPVKTNLHKKYPQFDQIILMVARLTKEKNIALAIEAMREVIGSHPRTGLIIVGSGPEEQSLKLKTKTYKLEPNIVFEPWTDDLPSYYKTADLFLLTSFYEGASRALLEAVAAGCLVVSTDVGAARDFLPVENIVPVNDPSALAEKIILALEGKLVSPQELAPQSQKSYLQAYKVAWEQCLN